MRNLAKYKTCVYSIASCERCSVFIVKTISKVSGVGAEGSYLGHLLFPRYGNFLDCCFARSSFIMSARFGEVTDSKGSRD